MSCKDSEIRVWQSKLYDLQREAPMPHLIPCFRKISNRPPQYGLEFHGPISRQETDNLLKDAPNGSYLIRQSQRGANAYTLVIWFDNIAKNYKLFYDVERKQHYVGEKRFDTVECLVADGLIHFHIETRGAEVLKKMAEAGTYERTPFYKMRYHTFNGNILSSELNQNLGTSVDSPACNIANDLTAADGSNKLPVNHNLIPTVDQNIDSGKQFLRHLSMESEPLPCTYNFDFCSSTVASHVPVSNSVVFDKGGRFFREFAFSNNQHFSVTMGDTSGIATEIPPLPPPRTASTISASMRIPFANHPDWKTCDSSTLSVGANSLNISIPFASDTDRVTIFNPTFTQSKLSCSAGNHIGPSRISNLSDGVQPKNQSALSPTLEERNAESFTPPTDTSSNCSAGDSPVARSIRSASITSSLWGQSQPRAIQPIHSSTMGDESVTVQLQLENNGTKNQAVLELLERYQLPTACLAPDQAFSSDFGRKKHNFKAHTFRGPSWCDFCTHFIWGLVTQGVRCMDCGFQAHKRCSDRVPDDCLPDIKHMKRVFGVDLTNLTIAERKPIPTILERCVNEVERRGLILEGLYRIPGNHDRIEQARAAFDKDCESAPLSPSRVPDVNVITSLIKSFLRQLPVPLITYDAHPKLLEIMRNEALSQEERLVEIATVLSSLPQAHYESLRFFLRHIHRVSENHEKNMMRVENLAVVLTPSLMNSSYSNPNDCVIGMRAEHALTVLLIKEYARLFPSTDPSPIRRTTAFDFDDTFCVSSPKTTVSPRPQLTSSRKLWFMKNRHSVGTALPGDFTPSASSDRENGLYVSSSVDSAI